MGCSGDEGIKHCFRDYWSGEASSVLNKDVRFCRGHKIEHIVLVDRIFVALIFYPVRALQSLQRHSGSCNLFMMKPKSAFLPKQLHRSMPKCVIMQMVIRYCVLTGSCQVFIFCSCCDSSGKLSFMLIYVLRRLMPQYLILLQFLLVNMIQFPRVVLFPLMFSL